MGMASGGDCGNLMVMCSCEKHPCGTARMCTLLRGLSTRLHILRAYHVRATPHDTADALLCLPACVFVRAHALVGRQIFFGAMAAINALLIGFAVYLYKQFSKPYGGTDEQVPHAYVLLTRNV